MRKLVALSAAIACVLPVQAATVRDDFESGTNPDQWGWTNNGGGVFTIVDDGGNPGAWLDRGVPYFSDHPNLTSIPAVGSALQVALASGRLQSASADIQRLDTSAVQGCHPVDSEPSTFSLSLIDIHSAQSVIEAHVTDGPTAPDQGPYAWTNVSFAIPSDATDTPPGWVLNAPPELGYTWADLMHNIDGMRFFVVDPDDLTFDACWDLGADNVTVTYSTVADAVFADGFEAPAG